MPKPKKEPPIKVRFKVAQFVLDHGGPTRLAETASLAGVSGVTYDAAFKWLERDTMPLRAFASVLMAFERLDECIPDPMDYIEVVRA